MPMPERNERLTRDEPTLLATAAGILWAIGGDESLPEYGRRGALRALAALDEVSGDDTPSMLTRLEARDAEAGEQR